MSIGQVKWLIRSQWQNGPHEELQYGITQTKLNIGCTPTLVFRSVTFFEWQRIHMSSFQILKVENAVHLQRRHEGHTPWNEWWQQHLERLPLASFKLATVFSYSARSYIRIRFACREFAHHFHVVFDTSGCKWVFIQCFFHSCRLAAGLCSLTNYYQLSRRCQREWLTKSPLTVSTPSRLWKRPSFTDYLMSILSLA